MLFARNCSYIKSFVLILLSLFIISCGGGGSLEGGDTSADPTDPNSSAGPYALNAELLDSEGNTVSSINSISSLTLRATLTLNNEPASGTIITFGVSDSGFVNLSGTTVATDAQGVAQITVTGGTEAGSGTLLVGTQEALDGVTSLNVPFTYGGSSEQAVGTIELLASSVQLASSGTDQIELMALVKNGQNNLMPGIDVSFSTDSGAILVVDAQTAETGIATAVLNTLNNPETRTINVVASAGGQTANLTVNVTGTTIRVTGNNSVVTGDTVEMSVVMLDSDGDGIQLRQPVMISSSNSNTITNADGSALSVDSDGNSFITTDSTGNALFRYQASNSGNDILTAQALGESGTLSISVSPDSFVISDLEVGGSSVSSGDVPLSGGNLTLTWLKNGSPHSGGVLFSLTRGAATSVSCSDNVTPATSTDGNGQICVNFTSTDAGVAILTATAEDISASFEFEFVAETAHQIDLQASPFSIGPNGQKSTVSAVVRDQKGNLVKNRPVNFRLHDVSGGDIFPASDVTDSNGLATTVYTSNIVSANQGVIVAACTDVSGDISNCVNTVDDMADDNRANDTYGCTDDVACVSGDVKLSVADRELFIELGTGNTVGTPNDQEYEKTYSIIVTDADSNPVEGVELVVSAVPISYHEGFWGVAVNADGDFERYFANVTGTCINEDLDGDGVLDRVEDINGNGVIDGNEVDYNNNGIAESDGVNEDINENGRLDPGNVVAVLGDFITDANGSAEVNLRYAESYGAWVNISLEVSTRVAGTEHIAIVPLTLPISTDDVTDENNAPTAPLFGSDGNCATVN